MNPILKDCADHFKSARKDILAGAILLERIYSQELYKASYESFGAYVNEELQIGPSQASKLISVVKTYLVEGGLKKSEISDIEPERLYLAIRTKGSLAAKVERARLLTRSDLKQELASKDGHDCEHLNTIKICATCHARV